MLLTSVFQQWSHLEAIWLGAGIRNGLLREVNGLLREVKAAVVERVRPHLDLRLDHLCGK